MMKLVDLTVSCLEKHNLPQKAFLIFSQMKNSIFLWFIDSQTSCTRIWFFFFGGGGWWCETVKPTDDGVVSDKTFHNGSNDA